MSGSGGIIGGIIGVALFGAVLIPVAIAGAVVAGSVFAVRGLAAATKGAVHLAKDAHAANEQRRVNNVYSGAARLLTETESVSDEMKREMAEAANEVCELYANSMDEINKTFSEEPDTSAFVKKYEAARRRFAEDFQEKLEHIESRYSEPMKAASNRAKKMLESERSETLASISAMKEDMDARSDKSRAAANEIIERTRATICEFAESHRDNLHAHDYAEALNRAVDTAAERFDQGQYEAAVIGAYDAYAKCITTVESIMAEDAKVDFLYERCTAAIAEIESHMEKTHYSDYEFEDTPDGEPVKYENIDMTPYYAGTRECIRQQLDEIKALLSSREKYGFTPEEIIDIIVKTDDLGMQYIRNTATAFERLYNHIDRIQMADLIAAAYAEMGFEEVEPEDAPSPLEAVVVQMENSETGEIAKIYLGVRVDENSHVSTSIDIYNHSNAIGADTERRRSDQRENVCRFIMNSEMGQKKGIVATQICHKGTNGKNAF